MKKMENKKGEQGSSAKWFLVLIVLSRGYRIYHQRGVFCMDYTGSRR
jgi:hypothetical protein